MLVDIGVPVYNGGWKLDRALTTLRSQTYPDIRILVADNGSTDESRQIVNDHARNDPRVMLLDGPQDGSATANFTLLLQSADAPFFMWAAHDDVWDATFIESGVIALAKGSNYFSPNWWVGDIGSSVGFRSNIHPLKFLESDSRSERFLNFANMNPRTHKCNLVYALFRRDFLLRAYEMHDIGNDGLLSLALCFLGSGCTTDHILFYKDNTREARRLRAGRVLLGVPPKGRMLILDLVTELVKRLGGLPQPPHTFSEYTDAYYEEACKLFPEYRDPLVEIAAHHRRFTVRDELMADVDSYVRVID